MKFFSYLFHSSKTMILVVTLAGLVSGACSAGLIAIINSALHASNSVPGWLLLGFMFLFIGKICAYLISKMLLVRFAQGKIWELCHQISETITRTPLKKIEDLGVHKIFSVLTGDVVVLGAAMQALPTLAINSAVLLGCASYLIWLSYKAFFAVLGLFLLGGLGYKFLRDRAYMAIFRSREMRDVLYKNFRTLTEGIKELQMNHRRTETFLSQQLRKTTDLLKRYNVRASDQYLIVESWSQLLFYGMIGVLLFLSPVVSSMTNETLTGYIFAVLYMMSPMYALIGNLPIFVRGQVSLQKIEALGADLASNRNEIIKKDSFETFLPWQRLDLKDLTFTYKTSEENGEEFQLGPLDFSLQPGETVFVIGGNGSGKSTFVKLLVGLYTPQTGNIVVNGKEVTSEEIETYRQLFSIVFSDFFLFDQILGESGPEVDTRAKTFLHQLQLEKKVQVENGKFSTIKLSQGQRKRLAMLSVLIEDHPIFVFDEWAADQDPHYKEIFYTELLPSLKARGKAVVVITHDDRYFSMGDRIVKFDYGQLVPFDNVYTGTKNSVSPPGSLDAGHTPCRN